jgi:hypothetical protein
MSLPQREKSDFKVNCPFQIGPFHPEEKSGFHFFLILQNGPQNTYPLPPFILLLLIFAAVSTGEFSLYVCGIT